MNASDDLTLLFLHALPLDGRMWKDQLRIWPQNSHAPNLYRFGSDIEDWAVRCLDGVRTDRIILVGCSVGGSCALEILGLAPERVSATILIGTKARHDPDPAYAAQIVEVVETQGVAAAWRRYWRPLFAHRHDDRALQNAERIAMEQSERDLIQGLTAFHKRRSREGVVARCQSPLHIVTGDQDVLPGLEYAQALADTNPRAHLNVIENCGHYVPMMQPNAVSALIRDVVEAASGE